jgi:hypothetical protein
MYEVAATYILQQHVKNKSLMSPCEVGAKKKQSIFV